MTRVIRDLLTGSRTPVEVAKGVMVPAQGASGGIAGELPREEHAAPELDRAPGMSKKGKICRFII